MLDTNTASYVIKGNAPGIDARLRKLDVLQVCISAVTRAGLRFGVHRLSSATRFPQNGQVLERRSHVGLG